MFEAMLETFLKLYLFHVRSHVYTMFKDMFTPQLDKFSNCTWKHVDTLFEDMLNSNICLSDIHLTDLFEDSKLSGNIRKCAKVSQKKKSLPRKRCRL